MRGETAWGGAVAGAASWHSIINTLIRTMMGRGVVISDKAEDGNTTLVTPVDDESVTSTLVRPITSRKWQLATRPLITTPTLPPRGCKQNTRGKLQ